MKRQALWRMVLLAGVLVASIGSTVLAQDSAVPVMRPGAFASPAVLAGRASNPPSSGSSFLPSSGASFLSSSFSSAYVDARAASHAAGQSTGTITGTVTSEVTGAPVEWATVYFFTASGTFAGGVYTDAAGDYTSPALGTGSYHVMALPALGSGLLPELYDDLPCPNGNCTATDGTPVAVTAPNATTGVNFVLPPGGTISGTVTNAATSAAVENAYVYFYTSSGQYQSYTWTNAAGEYTSEAMPAGSYFVVVYPLSETGLLSQVYQGPSCAASSCAVTDGALVPLAVSNDTPDIDVALQPGATITGTVTSAATSAGVEGVMIALYTSAGVHLGWATTNAQGQYTSMPLMTGSYLVRAFPPDGSPFLPQLYQNIPCPLYSCSVLDGTPVPVTVPNATANIDFPLQTGGRIAGTVTSAATNQGLGSVTLAIYDSGGDYLTSVGTNAQGQYASDVLAPGSYFVVAYPQSVSGLLPQLYDGMPCAPGSCNVTNGTPVVVAPPAPTANIDFALIEGGRISGTVTNATTTAPIENVWVTFYTSSGQTLPSVQTNAQGQYTSQPFEAGSYFVRATPDASTRLLSQVYQNLPCGAGCSVLDGTPVAVTTANVTSNIDFPLQPGATFSGTVTSAATSTPVADATVEFYSSDASYLGATNTDAQGQYSSPVLPSGSYFAVAHPPRASGLLGQLYNGLPCPYGECSVLAGTPIAVAAPSDTPNVNFALPAGGRITGTLTHATTGAPVENVAVYIHASDGAFVDAVTTNGQGQYLSSGLPNASYFVRAVPPTASGLLNQIYRNVACTFADCPVTSGTPVAVTAPATVSSIDFALQPGAFIAGTITHAATHAPLDDVRVEIYTAERRPAGVATTDAQGQYTSSVLASGAYYVIASPEPSSGVLGQLYDGVPCAFRNCSLSDGTLVPATGAAVTANIDFALPPGGSITGTVKLAATGVPLEDVEVQLFTVEGEYAGYAFTNAQGQYTVPGLPSGSYLVLALPDPSSGALAQLYDGVLCANFSCSPDQGTPVAVTAPNATANINFALPSGGRISGRVTEAANGGPIEDGNLRIFDSAGREVARATTNSQGEYVSAPLPSGSFFVLAASTAEGHAGQLYQGIPCTGCSVTQGTPVGVTVPAVTPGIDFALRLAPAAANDLHANALPLDETPYQSVVDARAATASADDPLLPCVGTRSGRRSVWYTLSVGASGSLRLNTNGSSYDTVLAVYTGTPGSFTILGCDDDGGQDYSSALDLDVTAGQQLSIMVSSYGTRAGVLALNATFPLTLATNPAALQVGATKAGPGGDLLDTTPSQPVMVSFTTPVTMSWTASTGTPWLQVSGGTGYGDGQFTVSVVNPGNVIGASTALAGSITLTSGADNSLVTIPVSLVVDQTGGAATAHPFGMVETPRQNTAGVVGTIAVTGWALDDVGVEGVRIYRNCMAFDSPFDCVVVDGERVVFVGDATLVAGARPDVEAAFPEYPQANRAAWGYLLLTNMLPHVPSQQMFGGQGSIILFARARDMEGKEAWLGRTRHDRTPTVIEMANDTIAVPFGAIDTPAQGETVSGTIANFGWALTPDGDAAAGSGDIVVPADGSTLRVYIDGVPGPAIAYDQCRGSFVGAVLPGSYCDDDVASIFGNVTPLATFTPRQSNPTKYRNLDAGRGAIGAYLLDTTQLSNGVHTIMWGVTDSAGRGEGLGSRYFTVLNGNVGATSPAPVSAPAADPAGAPGRFGRDIVPGGADVRLAGDAAPGSRPLAAGAAEQVPGGQPGAPSVAIGQAGHAAGAAAAGAPGAGAVRSDAMPAQGQAAKAAGAISEAGSPGQARPSAGNAGAALRTADGMSALETAPAQVRGDARALEHLALGASPVHVRTGFSDRAPYVPLEANELGVRHVWLPELGRVELRLGPVDAGYLVANGTLRDLPVGSRLDPARGLFTWGPGAGYLGSYELVFVRGGEQVRVVVRVGR